MTDQLSMRERGRNLLEELRRMGLLNHGCAISAEIVQSIAGIDVPEVGRKEDFQKPALDELAVVDYVRNVLLAEGKYITADRGGYRILLPSENAGQVMRYMRSADSKLRRAIKLGKSTPPGDPAMNNNLVRAQAKRNGLKAKRDQAQLTGLRDNGGKH